MSEEEIGATAARDDRPRLRGALLGYRRADVERELDASRRTSAELRREIAALWLAFARQERAIGELAGSLERSVQAPARSPGPQGEGTGSGTIDGRLSDLDEVLAAIEAATASLGRSIAGIGPPDARGETAASERPGVDR